MAPSHFEAVEGLDELVAHMIAPEVRKIALRVQRRAMRTAPAAKRWVSMSDADVRVSHQIAHDHPGLPENLRFEVPEVDFADGGIVLTGGNDWLLRPRDTSGGLPLDGPQHVHCRCHVGLLPAAIAKTIKTERTRVYGTDVSVTVSCTHYKIVECEFGDTYDSRLGPITEPGTRFMGKAAAHVAATSR